MPLIRRLCPGGPRPCCCAGVMANSTDQLPATREQIDAATQELRSLTSGRHKPLFDTAQKLARQGLSEDAVRRELLQIAGHDAKMQKKVRDAMKSLKGEAYRWLWAA